jgi:hypothetical protein
MITRLEGWDGKEKLAPSWQDVEAMFDSLVSSPGTSNLDMTIQGWSRRR